MDVVLNELSFHKGDTGRAIEWYNTFFDTCIHLSKQLNSNIYVITTSRISNIILDEKMIFHKWLSTVLDREKKSAIISMVSKKPILHEYPYYYFKGNEAKGLGYAYENDLLPISLDNNREWHNLFLNIEIQYINEELDEINEENLEIKHSWDIDSSNHHLNYLNKKQQRERLEIIDTIDSGTELWNRREELFPYLQFCESTEGQVGQLSGIILRSAYKRFFEMNDYFSVWKEGDFENSGFGGDPRLESETRERKFKTQLTIKCSDKNYRLFSYHCNYGTKDLRLHFFPDKKERVCYIGYLGKKIN